MNTLINSAIPSSYTNSTCPVDSSSIFSRNITLLLLVFIIVLAACLRLYQLDHLSFWYDEAISVMSIGELGIFSREGVRWIDAPLFSYLLLLWTKLGSGDFFLRLLPCLIGIATVPAAYCAAEALFHKRATGLLTAAFVAICPYQVYYSQELRVYSLMGLISVCALWLYTQMVTCRRLRDYAGFALCCALGLYAHNFFLLNIAAFNIAYLIGVLRKEGHPLRQWLFTQTAIGLLFLPGLIQFLFSLFVYFGIFGQNWWIPKPSLLSPLITFKNFFVGYTPRVWLHSAGLILFGLLVFWGIVNAKKQKSVLAVLLSLGLLPTATAFLFSLLSPGSLYLDRYLSSTAFAWYLLAAAGIASLPMKSLSWCAGLVAAALMTVSLSDVYGNAVNPYVQGGLNHNPGVWRKDDFRGAAQFIREHSAENDLVVHTSIQSLPSLRYYLPLPQWTVGFNRDDVVPAVTQEKGVAWLKRYDFYPHNIDRSFEVAPRVWLIQSSWGFSKVDPKSERVSAWFAGHGALLLRKEFTGLNVLLYEAITPQMSQSWRLPQRISDDGSEALFWRDPTGRNASSIEGETDERLFKERLPHSAANVSFHSVLLEEHASLPNEPVVQAIFHDTNSDGLPDEMEWHPSDAVTAIGQSHSINNQAHTLLGFDEEGKRACFMALPMVEKGQIQCLFDISNGSGKPVTYRYQAIASAWAADAESFFREDDSTWNLVNTWNPHPPPRVLNTYSMTAHFTSPDSPSSTIYVPLPPLQGRFNLFAEIFQTGEPKNTSRANLIYSTDDTPIGLQVANVPNATSGWTIRSAREVVLSSGESKKLRIEARNDDKLPEAWANLEQLFLFPAPEDPSSSPQSFARQRLVLPIARGMATVPAGDFKSVSLFLPSEGLEKGRVDVRVEDATSKRVFRIYSYFRSAGEVDLSR